jgi:type III secretory pathway component EscR
MKLLAAILVLLHMNFSMFIPQVDEVDIYDANGCQTEDVNSLVDFISVSLHPQKKHHKKDTDDDNARYFHSAKLGRFFYQPVFSTVKAHENVKANHYSPLAEPKLSTVFYDIQSPPPKS